jgi:hypothetical protein
MHKFTLIKQAAKNWRRGKMMQHVYKIPDQDANKTNLQWQPIPEVIHSNLWGTLVKQVSKYYILDHRQAHVGLQELLIDGNPVPNLKNANISLSAQINKNYVVLLVTWDKNTFFWQQAFLWKHSNYSHGMELDVPTKVKDIEILFNHWLALAVANDDASHRRSLIVYHLKHPKAMHILFNRKCDAYLPLYSKGNDFTLCAVTMNTNMNIQLVMFHPDGTVSHVEKAVALPNSIVQGVAWNLMMISPSTVAVHGTAACGYIGIYSLADNTLKSLFLENGKYYVSRLANEIIAVCKENICTYKIENSSPIQRQKCIPENRFRVFVMSRFCVLEHTPGEFTVMDTKNFTSSARGWISLSDHMPPGCKPFISDLGIAFISGYQLQIHSVFDL